MPSEVTQTGPKGYITKGDVLAFIEGNKVLLGERKLAAEKASKPSKPAAKKAAAPKQASAAKDVNDPFKQTWTDNTVEAGFAEVA